MSSTVVFSLGAPGNHVSALFTARGADLLELVGESWGMLFSDPRARSFFKALDIRELRAAER